MKFSEVMVYYDYKMIHIARALNVSRLTVKSWKEKDKIPFTKQCELQVLSNNKLMANRDDA
jgi:uncharacterized protein YjcR